MLFFYPFAGHAQADVAQFKCRFFFLFHQKHFPPVNGGTDIGLEDDERAKSQQCGNTQKEQCLDAVPVVFAATALADPAVAFSSVTASAVVGSAVFAAGVLGEYTFRHIWWPIFIFGRRSPLLVSVKW